MEFSLYTGTSMSILQNANQEYVDVENSSGNKVKQANKVTWTRIQA